MAQLLPFGKKVSKAALSPSHLLIAVRYMLYWGNRV